MTEITKAVMAALGLDDPESAIAISQAVQAQISRPEVVKSLYRHTGIGASLPYSEESEEAFLSCILSNPKKALQYDQYSNDLFYLDRTRLVWQAVKELSHNGKPINSISILETTRNYRVGAIPGDEVVGGQVGIEMLQDPTIVPDNIDSFFDILKGLHLRRQAMEISSELVASSAKSNHDIEDLMLAASKALVSSTGTYIQGTFFNGNMLADVAKRHLEMLKKWHDEGIEPDWATSPIDNLNKLTGGWKPPNLVIIAGRPGMGKTAYVLSELDHALDRGEDVAFFSLEMSNLELAMRLLVMNTDVSNEDIRTGNISDMDMNRALKYLDKLREQGVHIDDTAALSIDEMRSRARKLANDHNIKRIYVDYLQLMTPGKEFRGNREQAVSQITQGLKAMAKELDVPVIALAQLSRAVEIRGGDNRPKLSDLRESGSLEQEADIVGFVYRPQYYNIKEDEEGVEIKWSEIIIAKHRNGPLDTIRCMFLPHNMKWTNFVETSNLGPLPPPGEDLDNDLPW